MDNDHYHRFDDDVPFLACIPHDRAGQKASEKEKDAIRSQFRSQLLFFRRNLVLVATPNT